MGTFGSRTTPEMSARLRRVAAAARESILELAAKAWGTNIETLTASEGKITRADSKESLDYPTLLKGQQLTRVVTDEEATTSPSNWTIAGKSHPKVNGRPFVTGAHRFASDMSHEGMVFGKILRPPTLGATLESVDSSAVEGMSNVELVREGDFVGVVAPSELTATRALRAVEARWKQTPQISGKELYEHLKKQPADQSATRGGDSADRAGSIQSGLDASDVRLKRTYTVAYIAHAPLEPRAALANWENGRLTVWTGTQRPFGVRGELASAMGIPESSIRVIVPDTGSGYGGKHTGEAAVEAARLSKATGKPVKVTWTRSEEFMWAYARPAGVIEITSGATRSGKIEAWEFHNYNSGGSGIRTPYEVTNRLIQFHPSQSPLSQGSYRALAATANHFARECHMDELAHELGLNPLEFRRSNLREPRLRAVLEASSSAFAFDKAPAKGHGIGLACGTEKGGYVATCAEVTLDEDTKAVRVTRVVCAFECGAIVNPDHLKSQVEGALVQGLGGALFEAIEFDNGKVLNPRFSRYRVPRFADTPAIEVILLDRKDLPPAGAGETPIIAIAPAVGNAIFQATGVRLSAMPLVPHGLKS
jgi:isoquinoline 1-oxidoreductase